MNFNDYHRLYYYMNYFCGQQQQQHQRQQASLLAQEENPSPEPAIAHDHYDQVYQEQDQNIANLPVQTVRPEKGKQRKQREAKPYANLKPTARRLRKREYEKIFKEAASSMHKDVKSVKVSLEFDTGTQLSFFPRKGSDRDNTTLEDETVKTIQDVKNVQRVIAIKDKYRISDEALHELHMLMVAIPSKNKIQEERKRLNSTLELFSHPTADCTRRKAADIIEYVMKQQKFKELYAEEETLLLRFSCDGAKIAKNINSVRGVFKILTPRHSLPKEIKELSMSPEDEYSLFFYIGDESRPVLENLVLETFEEMQMLQTDGIELDGKKYSIKWIMTCDWKALSLIKGINGAQCDHFCMWCHCSKRQICDFSIPSWPIQRSPEEQLLLLEKKEQGYKDRDLCPFIHYMDMPIDDLHLRIRISLKLFNQVVTWSIDQKAEEKLQRELKRIGVSFRIWEERGDDKLNTKVKKWSRPTGDDLRRIIEQLQLHNVLENRNDRRYVSIESLTISQLKDELASRNLEKKGKKCDLVSRLKQAIGNNTKIKKKSNSRLQVSYEFSDEDEEQDLDIEALQQLWETFHDLMESLRSLPGTAAYKNEETFQKEAMEWASNFRKQTFDEDVIPYIHALVYHVPQFLERFKYLHDIGVAQVERKNFDHRQAYFGSTNRNGGKFKQKISKQILERENRMLWVDLEGVDRKRRPYLKKI